jgi:N-acetylglutamate synthase-like GNAT family acetyltransferase
MIVLRQANRNDRSLIIDLLAEARVGYTDPPEAYLLAVDDKKIAGCGRMEDQGNFMMLRPLVVASGYRKRGVGSLILKNIIRGDRPTMLVARGEAVKFYKSNGFLDIDWIEVPPFQSAECESCPERVACKPQPMICIPEK